MTRDPDLPAASRTFEAVISCRASWQSAVDKCPSQAAQMTLMKPVIGRSGEERVSHVIVVVTVADTFNLDAYPNIRSHKRGLKAAS
jgi:hypothetical protein